MTAVLYFAISWLRLVLLETVEQKIRLGRGEKSA